MANVLDDSLHIILNYLEVKQRLYEETSDPERLDPVFMHVPIVREWLSSINKQTPGMVIEIGST